MCSIDVTSPCGQYLKSYTPVQTQIIFSGVGYTESMNMGLHGDIFKLPTTKRAFTFRMTCVINL